MFEWLKLWRKDPGTILVRPSETVSAQPVLIPDHTLIRRVGSGAYGEVWLATNDTLHTFRAVKIIYRARFRDDGPFNRELEAIKKFDRVSRCHPGLIQLLHTGKSREPECFYYVMEIADDEETGETIRSERYRPKTLRSELGRKGRFTPTQSLDLGLALSSALGHLHHHGLTHRDIKPANIIFRRGAPQLADMGLLTEIGEGASRVGTEYFIPPEGPGRPPADIYALGKVLYVATTGKDVWDFPEWSADSCVVEDQMLLRELSRMIVKACAENVESRYSSARAMQADLEGASPRLSGGGKLPDAGPGSPNRELKAFMEFVADDYWIEVSRATGRPLEDLFACVKDARSFEGIVILLLKNLEPDKVGQLVGEQALAWIELLEDPDPQKALANSLPEIPAGTEFFQKLNAVRRLLGSTVLSRGSGGDGGS